MKDKRKLGNNLDYTVADIEKYKNTMCSDC